MCNSPVWCFFQYFLKTCNYFGTTMVQKNQRTFFSLKIKNSEKQKCVHKLFLSKSKILKRLNHRISDNLQNFNQKIRNFQFWYIFYGNIVFQWFLKFQLNSVYLILQNLLRRKELENFNNFSLKNRPELTIGNFLITILRMFCEFVIQSF